MENISGKEDDSSPSSKLSESNSLDHLVKKMENITLPSSRTNPQSKFASSSRPSKFDDPTLDPNWLFPILQKEINKEATYYLENDAKLRAVSQGTVNYEQFRQMVLGAHLHPLERKDKVEGCQNGKRPYVVWNTAAGKKRDDNDSPAPPRKEELSRDSNEEATEEFCMSTSNSKNSTSSSIFTKFEDVTSGGGDTTCRIHDKKDN